MPTTKEKTSDAKPNSQKPATEASHADIAVRAYYLYLDRGAIDGYDLSDWLKAESQLRKETAISAPSIKAKSA